MEVLGVSLSAQGQSLTDNEANTEVRDFLNTWFKSLDPAEPEAGVP